jgi:hypothetical protein
MTKAELLKKHLFTALSLSNQDLIRSSSAKNVDCEIMQCSILPATDGRRMKGGNSPIAQSCLPMNRVLCNSVVQQMAQEIKIGPHDYYFSLSDNINFSDLDNHDPARIGCCACTTVIDCIIPYECLVQDGFYSTNPNTSLSRVPSNTWEALNADEEGSAARIVRLKPIDYRWMSECVLEDILQSGQDYLSGKFEVGSVQTRSASLGAHPPPLAHFLIAPDFVGTGVPPCIHKAAGSKCQLPVLARFVWRDRLFNCSRGGEINALGPGHVTAAIPNSNWIPITINLGLLSCRLWVHLC